jgi:hypothetical protein
MRRRSDLAAFQSASSVGTIFKRCYWQPEYEPMIEAVAHTMMIRLLDEAKPC